MANDMNAAPRAVQRRVWAAWNRIIAATPGDRLSPRRMPGVSARRWAEVERVFGLCLPADVRASFEHHEGFGSRPIVTPGTLVWFELGTILRRWRVNTATAYFLVEPEEARFQPPNSITPNQTVRFDAWNRGWFPLGAQGTTGSLVCVDMAPGPAGHVGQLIEVPGYHHRAPAVTDTSRFRVLASCLLEYLVRSANAYKRGDLRWSDSGIESVLTATGQAVDLAGVMALPSSWQHGHRVVTALVAVPIAPPEPPPQPEPVAPFDAEACMALEAGAKPRMPRLQREGQCATFAGGPRGHQDSAPTTQDVFGAMRVWAAEPTSPPFWVLVGVAGSGKSYLLGALAHAARQAHAKDPAKPVPLLLDLARHAKAPSLQAALDDCLAGAPGLAGAGRSTGAGALQAVRDGRCLLLLDNIHAAIAAGHDVWAWCRALLPEQEPRDPKQRRGARVLLSCTEEWFAHSEDLPYAATGLCPGWLDAWQAARLLVIHHPYNIHEPQWLKAAPAGSARPHADDASGLVFSDMPLARRPAWLACTRREDMRKEMRENMRDGATDEAARLRLLALSYPRWLQRCAHNGLTVELSASELMEAAQRLATGLWFDDAQAQAGGTAVRSVGLEDLDDTVHSLRPTWAPGALARATVQARMSLALQRLPDGRFELGPPNLWVALVASRLCEQALAGDVQAFAETLGHAPLDLTLQNALLALWPSADFSALETALRESLAAHPKGLLLSNLLAVVANRLGRLMCADPSNLSPAENSRMLPKPPQFLDLSDSEIPQLNLQGMDLRGAVLDRAQLHACNFYRAKLVGASLRGTRATDGRFTQVDATGIDASGLIAPRSVWRGATLEGAVFSDAKLAGADLRAVKGTPLSTADAETEMAELDATWPQTSASSQPEAPTLRCRPHWTEGPPAHPCCLLTSPDGAIVATGYANGTVMIWNNAAGLLARRWLGSGGAVGAMAFSPDSQKLITGHADGCVQVWQALRGTQLLRWQAHSGPVTCLATSPCGTWLASGSTDGGVMRWDLEQGERCGGMPKHLRPVAALTFHGPPGSIFVAWTQGETARLDISSGLPVVLVRPGDEALNAQVMSLISHGDRLLWLCAGPNGVLVRVFTEAGVQEIANARLPCTRAVLSPNGRWLALWPLVGESMLYDLVEDKGAPLPHEASGADLLAFAAGPAGLFVTSGGSPRRWDSLSTLYTGSSANMFIARPCTGTQHRLSWSADGQHFTSGPRGLASPAVFNAMTGRPLTSLVHFNEPAGSGALCFGITAVDGGELELTQRGDLCKRGANGQALWQLSLCTHFLARGREFYLSRVDVATFSFDGNWLALRAHSETRLQLWPVEQSPADLRYITLEVCATALAFSTDGALLVVGTDRGLLCLVRVADGVVQARWQAHAGAVATVAFVANGTRLLSFCDVGDPAGRVWDVETHTLCLSVPWTQNCPMALYPGPSGDVLAIAANSRTYPGLVVCIAAEALLGAAAVANVWRYQLRHCFARSVTLYPNGCFWASNAKTNELGLDYEAPSNNPHEWPRWLPLEEVPQMHAAAD